MQIIIPYGSPRYPSKNFKSRFPFKVMQHGQQQYKVLHLQYKVYQILHKMVSVPSFSQHYSCMQPCNQRYNILQKAVPLLQSIFTSYSTLFVHKILLTISTNIPFFYTSAIFHLPFFSYNHSKIIR